MDKACPIGAFVCVCAQNVACVVGEKRGLLANACIKVPATHTYASADTNEHARERETESERYLETKTEKTKQRARETNKKGSERGREDRERKRTHEHECKLPSNDACTGKVTVQRQPTRVNNRQQTLQRTCSTLQQNAGHCNIRRSYDESSTQPTRQTKDLATHCSTLQHTATYCSTLQHTTLV